jgi:hypothetical protein
MMKRLYARAAGEAKSTAGSREYRKSTRNLLTVWAWDTLRSRDKAEQHFVRHPT